MQEKRRLAVTGRCVSEVATASRRNVKCADRMGKCVKHPASAGDSTTGRFPWMNGMPNERAFVPSRPIGRHQIGPRPNAPHGKAGRYDLVKPLQVLHYLAVGHGSILPERRNVVSKFWHFAQHQRDKRRDERDRIGWNCRRRGPWRLDRDARTTRSGRAGACPRRVTRLTGGGLVVNPVVNPM